MECGFKFCPLCGKRLGYECVESGKQTMDFESLRAKWEKKPDWNVQDQEKRELIIFLCDTILENNKKIAELEIELSAKSETQSAISQIAEAMIRETR